MGKQLIERIAPLVQAALEQDYLFPAQGGRKSLAESITALVIARIDAERGKDAVAWRVVAKQGFTRCLIEREPSRNEFDVGETFIPLFLSPTIPEGWSISRSSKDYDLGQDVLIVKKDGIGGYAARPNDDNIASEILHALASDLIAAAQGERNAD